MQKNWIFLVFFIMLLFACYLSGNKTGFSDNIDKNQQEDNEDDQTKNNEVNKRINYLLYKFNEIDQTTNPEEKYKEGLEAVVALRENKSNQPLDYEYVENILQKEHDLFLEYMEFYLILYRNMKDIIDEYKDILLDKKLIAKNSRLKEVDTFFRNKLEKIYNHQTIVSIYQKDFYEKDIIFIEIITDHFLKKSIEKKP